MENGPVAFATGPRELRRLFKTYFAMRRRSNPRPSRPAPMSDRVIGSGTPWKPSVKDER